MKQEKTCPLNPVQDAAAGPQAVRGTAVFCFLVTIIGDIILSRKVLPASFFTPAFLLAAAFWIILLIGIIWIWRHKEGWHGRRQIIVFGIFALYLIVAVVFYKEYQAAYLLGLPSSVDPELAPSLAGGIVGVRVFLVLIGITAGIPVGPKIDGREYARRLREKTIQQEANWAKESVKGAKKDLQETVERLKSTLTPEEMQALLQELQSSSPEDVIPSQTTKSDLDTAGVKTDDVKESGWGHGI